MVENLLKVCQLTGVSINRIDSFITGTSFNIVLNQDRFKSTLVNVLERFSA